MKTTDYFLLIPQNIHLKIRFVMRKILKILNNLIILLINTNTIKEIINFK